MKNKALASLVMLIFITVGIKAQDSPSKPDSTSNETAHSILPNDGIIRYLPKDERYHAEINTLTYGHFGFRPTANFYFRPEGTFNYKGAAMPIDTGGLNFYLRGDFGARITLPKNIDLVFNLQSYGVYTRSLGPLDPNLTLYEAYVNMKSLDQNHRMSLQFGRMDIGTYGTELLIGNDAFGRGRSFESVRYRYHTDKWKSDLMWVQLYQQAPPAANFNWNHPIFLATLNTFSFSKALSLDVNLPYIIDQYNSGFRTSVFMPSLRFFGQTGNILYSAEYIIQTGTGKGILDETLSATVNANVMEVSAGYRTSDNKLYLDIAYYRGSGDDDPTDDEIKSYNVLWQNAHRRFGYIDAFKGSNVQATTIHVDWKIGRLVSTGAHGVLANVLELKDLSSGIATIPPGQITTTSTAIGAGGDVYINYYYSHNLNFQLSASMFKPGEYFTAANGLDENGDPNIEKMMTRLYLMMALKL